MSQANSLLEFAEVTCGYHGSAVLHSVTASCRSGEILALLGPNGSGKSTLIRALSGTLPLQGGTVRVDGSEIHQSGEKHVARLIATVPQEETHRFAFTVRQVVAMGRLPSSTSFFDTEEDISVTNRALERAECSDLADRPITELSGGERQRVLIARALAQETPVVLLDEPTAHLDASHQIATARLFQAVATEGKALVVAAHDLNFAALVAHRSLLLDHGRLVADLPMEGLLESNKLEETYGVAFERFRGRDGVLRVMPVR